METLDLTAGPDTQMSTAAAPNLLSLEAAKTLTLRAPWLSVLMAAGEEAVLAIGCA